MLQQNAPPWIYKLGRVLESKVATFSVICLTPWQKTVIFILKSALEKSGVLSLLRCGSETPASSCFFYALDFLVWRVFNHRVVVPAVPSLSLARFLICTYQEKVNIINTWLECGFLLIGVL